MNTKITTRLPTLTKPRQEKFLELLSKTGNMSRSAAELGLSYSTVSSLMSKDEYFKEMVQIAKAKYLGKLEDTAYKRAVDGVEENVYFQGQIIDTKTNYSDKLLETLLKAASPDKYGAKNNNQTNNTLIVTDSDSTVAALEKFLKIKDDDKSEESEDGGDDDVIDGEYSEE
ncbi:hypothetical protein [Haliea sp.]|uniref:hypothetical protein n=1 Tax=Haliea sp. TaxID=1932666 RepID=UPI0025C6F0E6|nr:hypothetical protein [Haliea sp.]|tara:strand:- start:2116 stop:2628 length:513 start_codon:yes stop_codon:yes gene_type:complete